ncbi:MAG: hypothetical protein JSR78_08945 [Proteobacteria bacterium]|nr:hypothetical protein [Pseudomonadota bacterium]
MPLPKPKLSQQIGRFPAKGYAACQASAHNDVTEPLREIRVSVEDIGDDLWCALSPDLPRLYWVDPRKDDLLQDVRRVIATLLNEHGAQYAVSSPTLLSANNYLYVAKCADPDLRLVG